MSKRARAGTTLTSLTIVTRHSKMSLHQKSSLLSKKTINISKNNKKNGTSSLASRRKDVRSPKGVEQRFTSSSSDDSDNSDTPKTPEHFGEDFEKEEPTSRNRTPRASPQALHVKMECSMSSTNVVRSRNTRSRGTPSTALSPSSSKSSNAKTKSIVNKQNIEKVQHKKKEEPVTIEKERVSPMMPEKPKFSPKVTTQSSSSSSSSSLPSSPPTTMDTPKLQLGVHAMNVAQDFISSWIEHDLTPSDQLQLHFLEKARTQSHLKVLRASIAQEMKALKKVIQTIYDDGIDLEDDILINPIHETNDTKKMKNKKNKSVNNGTLHNDPSITKRQADARLLASLTDSKVFLERPNVPVCGGDCQAELGFAEIASGENYPNGEWICDVCEKTHVGVPRWTCVEHCEYDLCCECASVNNNITSKEEVEQWEKRVHLLNCLADQPKRWWLDSRSDPSSTAASFQTPGYKNQFPSNASSPSLSCSETSGRGSKRKRSTSAFSSPSIDTIRQHKKNKLSGGTTLNGLPKTVIVPNAINMGTTIVGRAIEVQWGRQNTWYPGYVTDFMDGQHCVKYNNGEVEWISLYEQFNNGVEWQLLPQNMKTKVSEQMEDARPPANRWSETNVHWRKYHGVQPVQGMYQALFTIPNNGDAVTMGFYDTAVEAAFAYDRGVRIHGANLPTNFDIGENPLLVTAKDMGNGYIVTEKTKKNENDSNKKMTMNRSSKILSSTKSSMKSPMRGRSRHHLCSSPNLDIE